MFSFLQPKEAKSSVPQSMIMNLYYKYRLQSLIGIFIGYAAYYIVRNNFALSTHFLSDILHMSKTEIGLLSSGMLIAYGLSKGFMSSQSCGQSKSCQVYGFRSHLLCNYQYLYELCR